ncbi:MAG TPA: hypothetical protein VFV64_11865 [Permianibacter sp.]|nr:hypothetical protein [Permianibacter sp.]
MVASSNLARPTILQTKTLAQAGVFVFPPGTNLNAAAHRGRTKSPWPKKWKCYYPGAAQFLALFQAEAAAIV